MECPHCRRSFSTEKTLNCHQKTAKYCLKLQNGHPVSCLYSCECKYETNKKEHFNRHKKSCKKTITEEQRMKDELKRMTFELEDAKEKIKNVNEINSILKDKLLVSDTTNTVTNSVTEKMFHKYEKLALRPTTSITNTNNVTFNHQREYSVKTLHPFTVLENSLPQIIDAHYNEVRFSERNEGVKKFILQYVLKYDGKNFYNCFDTSGKVFHRKTNETDIEIDDMAQMFMSTIYPLIYKKAKSISKRLSDEAKLEYEETKEYREANNMEEGNELFVYNEVNNECFDTLAELRKLNNIFSKERKDCIKAICDECFISSSKIKNCRLIDSVNTTDTEEYE